MFDKSSFVPDRLGLVNGFYCAEGLIDVEVDDALEQLPESFREAVVLCDIHGLPYTEIAEALGVPIGTVRSRIARGRRLLAQALAEYARARGLI